MPGKLNVFDLGEKGVSLSRSPLHREDGSLIKAQNASLSLDQAEGGLIKRGGMPRLNSSALTGSVQALVGVPLVDRSFGVGITQTLYAAIDDGTSNNWRTSTDGASWSTATTPAKAQRRSKVNSAGLTGQHDLNGRIASFGGKIYYPENDYTVDTNAPGIRVFDGTTDSALVDIPFIIEAGAGNPTELIQSMTVFEERVYVTTFSDLYTAVYCINPTTGAVGRVGDAIASASKQPGPADIAGFQGRLWLALNIDATNSGIVYSIRPGVDTTWTQEFTNPTSLYEFISLAHYKGLLYLGTVNSTGGPVTRVRSSLGVITTSETPAGGAASGYTSGFIVYKDELYVAYLDDAAPVGTFEIRKFDGSSWSSDYNILGDTASAIAIGQPVIFNDKLYYVVTTTSPSTSNSAIIENDAGSWSVVDSGTVAFRGFLGIVEVET